MHLFNRDDLYTGPDPFELFPHIDLRDDTGHAFYLGVELARAHIAWQLGKHYTQDSELNWGCAVKHKPDNLKEQITAGTTMQPTPDTEHKK